MTDHPYMEAFFSALEEWEEATRDWDIIKLHDLAFLLSFPIGGRGPIRDVSSAEYVQSFKARATYLIDNQQFHEDFLITSLSRGVGEILHGLLENHGKTIVTNERIIEAAEEELGDSEFLQGKLRELKEPTYAIRALWTLDAWESICAVRLSRAHREKWQHEADSKTMKQLGGIWDGVPEGVTMALSGIKLKHLLPYLGSRSLTKLTVEEAEEIKRRVESGDGLAERD